jgi:hypothetical protein
MGQQETFMNVILCLLILFSLQVFAASKVAVVKLIRGEADVLTLGKTTKLKVDDWVENGSIVKTAEKSFVKLVFIDKSQMNVGPNSEMKIESFSGKDSGVIDLVKGKIRSQVTKDYLQIKDKDKSKLFIKTQNAVMGVRGTDFMISTNGQNTSTVLFEGEIVFNKLDARGEISSNRLEEIVDRGVRMYPGEFSVMEGNRPMPTVPSLLNVQQREQLEKNKNFDSDRAPSNSQSTETTKTVVPAGLSGQIVSNNAETLRSEVAQVSAAEAAPVAPSSSDPEGFVKGDQIKPANGSFVHIESGVIIPPGPGSVLDSNTNTYIPSPDSGKVATDGSYIPPKNVEITEKGEILVATKTESGETIVKEVAKPAPVVSTSGTSLFTAPTIASGTTSTGTVANPTAPAGSSTLTDVTVPGTTTVDTRFTPTGGFTGVTDPTRVLAPNSDVTIRVRPQN